MKFFFNYNTLPVVISCILKEVLLIILFSVLLSLNVFSVVNCGTTCITSAQVAQETVNYLNGVTGSKCLFIYNSDIYQPPKGTISGGKHKNLHSCGANVTGIMRSSHLANPTNYLIPYVCAPLCVTTQCPDADGDGFTSSACGGADCNDNNAQIKPGAAELCNNIDDNCNGQTDENLQQQQTCGIGQCQNTISQTCTAGTYGPACTPKSPLVEICGNNIDEDCNGVLNNGCACIPGQKQTCGSAVGFCRQGNQTCLNNGAWSICTDSVEPTNETCNQADDDCDGQIDEGLNCSNCTTGQLRQCGFLIGVCKPGNETCLNGIWGACIGDISPSKENCNGLDDDCNGLIDDGLHLLQKCGIGRCAVTIDQQCTLGKYAPPCVPKMPMAEICNNIDDNCNGRIDEDIAVICGSNIGECRKGTRACKFGELGSCVGEVKPKPEICDFLDNDCNGKVDEGDVCINNIQKPCIEQWKCEQWAPCINITISIRTCRDIGNCNSSIHKPVIERSCFATSAIVYKPTKEDTSLFGDSEHKILITSVVTLSTFGAVLAGIFSIKKIS